MLAFRPAFASARCLHRSGLLRVSTRATWLQKPAPSPAVACRAFSVHPPQRENGNEPGKRLGKLSETLRENIYTIPNLLTVSRIAACPVLGYAIIQDNFVAATALLVYAGLTDLVDGWMARRYNMRSVLGTILDPAADKTLMTTLTVTLAMKSLLPVPLAVIILGRDVLLSLSAFYIRYTSLPAPKTWARYWDFSIPSAEVHPTEISKVNTALQLLLMGVTTVSPILPFDLGMGLQALQWTVGATTVWSGASYLFSKNAVKIVNQTKRPPPPA
ncbi:CDP-diacylglycerol--glycerol-3-phosphate 3-phosphatidyltransferase [Phanerochaete sordida]|uniref:CDP-diacylglycerol--glycerol-3-phosphate 3-phosphatidyltransferase n=1 Tax=Phanerochaete sordida TaxID=48140 RepID=A0A9P3GP16_9APHY|nr:CDP-diacylglycerol--glycerol-3-phosphate 3-phosphatidyltransferase [Phanerochaete sordida]